VVRHIIEEHIHESLTHEPLLLADHLSGRRAVRRLIYLARRPGQRSARTEQVSPGLLIDYAADGTPLGIEIVSPGEVAMDEILGVFDRLGLGRPAASELAPLRAA
jgi:hypothetical protein